MKRYVFASLFLTLSAFSQEFRGTITGLITDSTEATVPGAKVTVTETQTGTKTQTVSDSAGQYTALFLLPGEYDIGVEAKGFKSALRKGVNMGAGEHTVIDLVLEIGNTAQTVEVTADAPILNSENASVGGAISTRAVEDLPLNGRTPLVLASLSIGVLATGQPSLIHPFDSGAAAGWSIGGTPSQTNEILIDGSPDATWDGRLAYSPPTDAVQEVAVKAFDADAAFGHTGGGTMNQILKSGTNMIHGSAWEFNEPNTLAANNYFNNKAGLGNPVTHYNQYGLAAGGPVMIPKLFDGRNKMFWFFAWEGLKDSQPNTTFLSVATAAERQGDFSALLPLGSQYQLYNPASAIVSGTTVTRSPYPNNIIPGSQLNPIALSYLQYMPLPNIAGAAGGLNNFGSTAGTPDNYNNELGRLDYNITSRDRMFFDIRNTDYLQSKNDYFGNISTGSLLTRANWGGSLDNVYTVNATNVFDVRLNFTRMNETHPSPSAGFDPTSLGFPAYQGASSVYPQLPSISFATNTAFTTMGQTAASLLPSQSLQLFGSWVKVKGSHTLKFGTDVRQYVLNAFNFGNSAGTFSFSANSFVRASNSASSTVVQGQDFAEFLLGLPTSGSYDVNTSAAYYEHYFAGFVQDDWRIRKNLTINLGIRYDKDFPYHEKYGRTVDGFDNTTPSPLSGAAVAEYNAHPIPQLPAGQFNVLGGLQFPGNGALYQQTSNLFSPRVGIAWSPVKLHAKTVIRAGFAMFAQPVTVTQLAISGAYSTSAILQQYGFSQTTSLVIPSTFTLPSPTLSNAFASGIKSASGSSLGLDTFAGQSIMFLAPQEKDPYSVRWNFGFQHSFSPNTVLEVVYMGNHGVHTPIFVTQENGIPRSYLSTLPVRDQPVITALTATYPNPFAGLATSQNGATATAAQLLAKFPQFPQGSGSGSTGIIELNNPAGSSFFQSLNVNFQKRTSNGLTVIANYIHSKLIEQDTWLNDTDAQPERRVSPFDHPDRIVFAMIYELPFGKGRHFNLQSKWADELLGGWGINSIYTYQVGAPITWVNGSTSSPGDYLYSGAPLDLNARENNVPAFNVGAFDVKSADQFQFHIRTFATTFGNLRQDGINEWSPSLSKRFQLGEKALVQLRFEAYNVLNHPLFAAPNTTATNTAFGTITAQANRPRTIQLGARFVF
jgi:hypothetical protein